VRSPKRTALSQEEPHAASITTLPHSVKAARVISQLDRRCKLRSIGIVPFVTHLPRTAPVGALCRGSSASWWNARTADVTTIRQAAMLELTRTARQATSAPNDRLLTFEIHSGRRPTSSPSRFQGQQSCE
jgi:hypothetical protein